MLTSEMELTLEMYMVMPTSTGSPAIETKNIYTPVAFADGIEMCTYTKIVSF